MAPAVLIVEDNAVNMRLVADLLGLHGYRVLQAATGAQALVLAEEQHPDLILMDIGLKGVNGLEITRMLKQNPNTAAIPVVALTAHAMDHDRAGAAEAGCAGFIAKPIDTRSFPKQIAAYLKGGSPDGRDGTAAAAGSRG